jgi:hypothetical protein
MPQLLELRHPLVQRQQQLSRRSRKKKSRKSIWVVSSEMMMNTERQRMVSAVIQHRFPGFKTSENHVILIFELLDRTLILFY